MPHASIYCPYCHKHTELSVANTTYRSSRSLDRYYTEAVYERSHDTVWWMGICNSCNGVVLVRNNGDFISPDPLPKPTDKRIPDPIRGDLDEAKRCLWNKCYRAAATMARRAVQQACIEQGASGKNLVAQIDSLFSSGKITSDLKEWATVIRWVGNDGAHPSSEPVESSDAEDSIELADQLFQVLYVAPHIASARRASRNK